MATPRYDNGSPANGTAAKKSAEAIEKTISQPTQLTIAHIHNVAPRKPSKPS